MKEELLEIYKDLNPIGVQDLSDPDEYLVLWNDETGSTKAIHVKLVNGEWEEQNEDDSSVG